VNPQYSPGVACWNIEEYLPGGRIRYWAHGWADKTPGEVSYEDFYKMLRISGLQGCYFESGAKEPEPVRGERRVIPALSRVWSVGMQRLVRIDEDAVVEVRHAAGADFFGVLCEVSHDVPGQIATLLPGGEPEAEIRTEYRNTRPYHMGEWFSETEKPKEEEIEWAPPKKLADRYSQAAMERRKDDKFTDDKGVR